MNPGPVVLHPEPGCPAEWKSHGIAPLMKGVRGWYMGEDEIGRPNCAPDHIHLVRVGGFVHGQGYTLRMSKDEFSPEETP